jgi:hypothetical protein
MDTVTAVVRAFAHSTHESWCVRYTLLAIGILGVLSLLHLGLKVVGVLWTLVRPSKVSSSFLVFIFLLSARPFIVSSGLRVY